CRSEEKEVANRPSRRCHSGHIHLVDVDDLLDRFILTDNQLPETSFQASRGLPRLGRIQGNVRLDHCVPLSQINSWPSYEQVSCQCRFPPRMCATLLRGLCGSHLYTADERPWRHAKQH